jgi:uncharacterized protein (DUF2147 family)
MRNFALLFSRSVKSVRREINMVARNDITGDAIQTKSASSAYRDNYDKIWKKDKDMQVRVKEDLSQIGNCGCGRSPTGKCIGWHGLSEAEFQSKLQNYLAEEADKESK